MSASTAGPARGPAPTDPALTDSPRAVAGASAVRRYPSSIRR